MKRFITVLAVAALMALMAMSVAGPAFASNPNDPNNPYATDTSTGGESTTTYTYKAPRAERDPVTGEKPPPPGGTDHNAKGGNVGFAPLNGICRGPGC